MVEKTCYLVRWIKTPAKTSTVLKVKFMILIEFAIGKEERNVLNIQFQNSVK